MRKSATASDGSGTRETVRRARTRERLLDAAYRQFCEHGINGTSIEAITDDAGYTRGAFYSNFDSKEELFLALTERENEVRLERLRDQVGDAINALACSGGKPGPRLIEDAIADLLALQPAQRQWCLLNCEFRLMALRDPSVAPRFLEKSRQFQRQLATLIDAALASVGLRFVVDSAHLTGILIDQFESALQEAVLAQAEDPEQAARRTIMRALPPFVHSLTELREPPSAQP